MKQVVRGGLVVLATVFAATVVSAQSAPSAQSTKSVPPDEPVVSMRVTVPGGEVRQLSAADSQVATSTVNGVEYGFEPTIQDSRPWDQVMITVFKMPTKSESTVELGSAEVKTGGAPVTLKTTPAFKVAISSVSPPRTVGRT